MCLLVIFNFNQVIDSRQGEDKAIQAILRGLAFAVLFSVMMFPIDSHLLSYLYVYLSRYLGIYLSELENPNTKITICDVFYDDIARLM